jgi:hypothetical protein
LVGCNNHHNNIGISEHRALRQGDRAFEHSLLGKIHHRDGQISRRSRFCTQLKDDNLLDDDWKAGKGRMSTHEQRNRFCHAAIWMPARFGDLSMFTPSASPRPLIVSSHISYNKQSTPHLSLCSYVGFLWLLGALEFQIIDDEVGPAISQVIPSLPARSGVDVAEFFSTMRYRLRRSIELRTRPTNRADFVVLYRQHSEEQLEHSQSCLRAGWLCHCDHINR